MTVFPTGLFFDGTALPMIAANAFCAMLTVAVVLVTLRSINHNSPAQSGAVPSIASSS